MASGLYVKGKEQLGLGNINFLGTKITACLVDTSIYNADLSIDAFQSDIPVQAIIAEKTMTGCTFENAVFDADDLVFPSLLSLQAVGAIVIFQDSGAYSTSPLIAYVDSAPQLPVMPDGTDFTIMWDNGPTRIFSL